MPDKATRDAEFSAFVAENSGALLRVAVGLTGSATAARELVQAALVKAYVVWPRIRTAQAYAFTRRIMANEKVDTWRATRRGLPTSDVPDRAHPPSSTLDYRDELLRLLRTLPRQQRAVVVLRYYEDLPVAEVAAILGISEGTVKSAASRGLAALRARAATDPTEAGAR